MSHDELITHQIVQKLVIDFDNHGVVYVALLNEFKEDIRDIRINNITI